MFYIIIYFTNGFAVFTTGRWKIADFIFAYLSLVIFLVAFLGYKLIVRPTMVQAKDVPLYAGRTAGDIEDEYITPEAKTAPQKFNKWLWG